MYLPLRTLSLCCLLSGILRLGWKFKKQDRDYYSAGLLGLLTSKYSDFINSPAVISAFFSLAYLVVM